MFEASLDGNPSVRSTVSTWDVNLTILVVSPAETLVIHCNCTAVFAPSRDIEPFKPFSARKLADVLLTLLEDLNRLYVYGPYIRTVYTDPYLTRCV